MLPLSVDLDASHSQTSFCTLADSARASAVEALGNHVIHCSLDCSGHDPVVLAPEAIVPHHLSWGSRYP